MTIFSKIIKFLIVSNYDLFKRRNLIYKILYVFILLITVVYSYSQIDLNLTLSANSLYQSLQNYLIFIGYYNRPISSFIFLLILFSLFIFYLIILHGITANKFNKNQIMTFIIYTVVILFFAYPAFSHDLFNYMFDARILTKYQANPYLLRALDFPNDLWIRFMHWTHRTYPYGPIWLLITIPFSYLGFEKFVLSLINFKIMFIIFHLGNIFLIYRIYQTLFNKSSLLPITFYALNPLILIESLVSPHNEVVMLFFLLLAFYYLFNQKKKFLSIFFLLLSTGVKFVTAIFIPLFLFVNYHPKKINIQTVLIVSFLLTIFVIMIEGVYRETYSWYFIILIGISSLLVDYLRIRKFVLAITVGSLLQYLPYLYTGEYTSFVRYMRIIVFTIPIGITLSWFFYDRIKNEIIVKKINIFRR